MSMYSYSRLKNPFAWVSAAVMFASAMVVTLWSFNVWAAPGGGQNVAIAKDFYMALGKGDMESAKSLAHPDVEWVFRGQNHILRYSGTFSGWQGVTEFFSQVEKNIDMQAFAPQMFSEVDTNIVSVIGSETGLVRRTGGIYTAKWVHLITFKDGLITHFEEITDSGAQNEAFAEADVDRGKAFFTTCVGCHGLNGEGNFGMNAPSLTTQDPGYLIRQLRNFRSHVRGGPADFYGWMMNGRSQALPGDRAVRDVVAYIDTLPDEVAKFDKVSGNAERGEALYTANCVSCHGKNGEGNLALNSPVIGGLQDWYLSEQLKKFRSGIRGTNDGDIFGAQMRPSALAIPDDESVKDIVEYVTGLRGS